MKDAVGSWLGAVPLPEESWKRNHARAPHVVPSTPGPERTVAVPPTGAPEIGPCAQSMRRRLPSDVVHQRCSPVPNMPRTWAKSIPATLAEATSRCAPTTPLSAVK
ncbi:hypothetical protein L615_008500000100 [Nocardioides sp. J9]|nr:hypothetical protein L615_008500000100 [Nocardioides sp. J9]